MAAFSIGVSVSINFSNSPDSSSVSLYAVTYVSENNHRIAHIKEPKTEAGNRCIPMMEDVRELLLDIKKEQDSIKYMNKQIIDGYTDFIFLSNRGKIFTREAVCAKLHRIIKAYNEECSYNEISKLPDITTHQFSHTFATFLCRNSSDLRAIQRIMGHESIVITLSIYADATETGVIEAMKALEKSYYLGYAA